MIYYKVLTQQRKQLWSYLYRADHAVRYVKNKWTTATKENPLYVYDTLEDALALAHDNFPYCCVYTCKVKDIIQSRDGRTTAKSVKILRKVWEDK